MLSKIESESKYDIEQLKKSKIGKLNLNEQRYMEILFFLFARN